MYLLNKKELKNQFNDYQDLSDKLNYENWTTLFRNKKRPYNKILDEGIFICPKALRDKLCEKGYNNCCFDVTDLLLDLIIVGEKAFSNITRIIVAIMIRGLVVEEVPIVYWSVDDILKYAKRYFSDDPVILHRDAVNDALKEIIFSENDKGYSLEVDQLAQMTYNVKP